MAAPTKRWLLPIFLLPVILPFCCPSSGPPVPPYDLNCDQPCDQSGCSVIHCDWKPKSHPDDSTTYSLHWEPINTDEPGGNSSDGFIHRENFPSHRELRVWVQARNEHGSVKSKALEFHIDNIKKPRPPTLSSSHQDDPLEIFWTPTCDQSSAGICDVRYRTEDDQNWLEHENGLYGSFGVVNHLPYTVYEFQVRCACGSSKMSDWSTIRLRSAELAPVGQVDIFVDCFMPWTSSGCFLTWKNLSIADARGFILGYEVTVSYNNGAVKHINVSTLNPSDLWVYDEMKWRLSSPLKDVSSVSVSAYSAVGATNAAHLFMPATGKQVNDQAIDLEMNEEDLTVSWKSPSHFPDGVKQYVVQYRECPPGKGFDWIRVNKSQTTASFKGASKKYTYQVSLFVVSNSSKIHQLSTAIGYPVQGVPSMVPSFKVLCFDATGATLFWEPVPYCKQNGVILFYQIVVGTQKVYNVSVTPDNGNRTYKLSDLSPGQEYEVWVSAVNAAGPGPGVSAIFKTEPQEVEYMKTILVLIVLLVIIFVILFCVCGRVNKAHHRCLYGKVPDPRNSHIFKHMKHQINEPLTWICIPNYEPNPKICLLEIVEVKPKALLDPDRLNSPVMQTGCLQRDCRDDQSEETVTEDNNRTDHRCRREEYSKMIDSDEERSEEWNSSGEEEFTSGYEKHFMPTSLEILQN